MIPFPIHADCTACPLHWDCMSPGIHTRPANDQEDLPAPCGHHRAVVIVGEAPGFNEDLEGKCWVGEAGRFLHDTYITFGRLTEQADVFLTNACRCRPPGNLTPTAGQINTCRQHLVSDLRLLQEHYQEILLFAVGAPAVASVWDTHTSLTEAFGRQSDLQKWGWAGCKDLQPMRIFATYHPINLSSKRNPSLALPISDHIQLLRSYLERGSLPVFASPPPHTVAEPPKLARYDALSLDIESYGAWAKCSTQTSFHPVKSMYWDKVTRDHLTQTVSLTWKSVGEYKSTVFDFRLESHRSILLEYLRRLRRPGGTSGWLMGMNIKFDILFLFASDHRFRQVIKFYKTKLLDLSVLNFLHSEMRPERSLKNIAPLLGITRYTDDENLKRIRFTSRRKLLGYNAKDSWATYGACLELIRRIRSDFPDSHKLSPYALQWFSDLIWTTIYMEEGGIAMNYPKLDQLDYSLSLQSALLSSECSARWNLILGGTGSEKSKRKLYTDAAELTGLLGDRRLMMTPKNNKISINQENATLLTDYLDPDHWMFKAIAKQREYEGLQKDVTSYTRPMLHGTKKHPFTCRLLPQEDAWLIHPSWFPVPSHFDSDMKGGTKQVRITGKGPAPQTFSERIKACTCSRYSPGFLLYSDLSQIERRIAGFLSNDPVMMDEYTRNLDAHSDMGKVILELILDSGQSVYHLKDFEVDRFELEALLSTPNLKGPEGSLKYLCRQMGKTTNFLLIYRGKGYRLRATIAKDIGVVLPLHVCDHLVTYVDRKYHVLRSWQESLIEEVCRTNRLELPMTGYSRNFIGCPKAVRDTYSLEICNLPVQGVSASILLDHQRRLTRRLAPMRPRVYIPLNCYDALSVDGHMDLYQTVRRHVDSAFKSSDYYDRLCQDLGRRVPLDYEVHVLQADGVKL